MKTKYAYSADLIRALAIFMVVIVHVFSEYLSHSTNFNSLNWWLVTIIQTSSKIAVPLFIILSGFLILDPRKKYSVSEFYKKRLSKVGIPILVWPFIFYFGFLIITNKPFDSVMLDDKYLFLNMFYHLYFLYIIFGLYLITPFLKKMLANCNTLEKKTLTLGLLLFSTLITLLVYFTPSKINYWTVFTVFIPFIGYFIAGDVLRNTNLSKKQFNFSLLIFLTLTILWSIAKYMAYSNGSSMYIRYLDDVLSVGVIFMSLLGYLILNYFSEHFQRLQSERFQHAIKFVAGISFGIYIIHPLFLITLNRIIGLNNIFELIIKACLVFGISCIFVLIANKLPVFKKLLGN